MVAQLERKLASVRELSYNFGFRDVPETGPISISWQGQVPPWLQGALFRNGPGRYNRGSQSVDHWFDGLALLHSLRLSESEVVYRSRFLRTRDFRQAVQTGRIDSPGFACDPCRDLFRKIASAFVFDATDNANVNVIKHGERYLALTELPLPIEFEPGSLKTLGPSPYSDALGDGSTTAHPHCHKGRLLNQVLHFSARPTHRFYQHAAGQSREEFARLQVENVCYVHSFGMSRRWMVLVRGPFQVKPLALLLRDRPFIENFRWKPEDGTRFHLLSRPGLPKTTVTLKGEPFFHFHHINSVDQPDGSVLVDLIGYEDASVIERLRLPQLARGEGLVYGRPRRYRCDPRSGKVERLWESQHILELPSFCYRQSNARPYRYVYGMSALDESLFFDRVIKLDVETDQALYWHEPYCYPGEPVFVAAPEPTSEDDGVLLTLVLAGERARSFLLVLDARDLSEMARAEIPQAVPHGFHGFFERSFP